MIMQNCIRCGQIKLFDYICIILHYMKKPGKITIKDIASAVGASTTLVSFALSDTPKKYRVSDEMIAKIRAKAAELDYHPNSAARILRSGRSNTVGVILSDISNRFFADIARCIEDKASQNGYTVLFGSTDEKPEKLVSLVNVFINKGVDGLIIVPCEGAGQCVSELVQDNFPLVLIDRTFDDVDVSSVTLNNVKATSIAVNELVRQGYKKIAYISYKTSLSNILDREMGYRKAMRVAGLADYIKVENVCYSEMKAELESLIPRLLDGGVEALIFSTNRLAIEALILLRTLGCKVPDDVAFVGFDGSETFAFNLYEREITYIKQPIEQFGYEAFDLLMGGISREDEKKVVNIELNPELIIKESSMRK